MRKEGSTDEQLSQFQFLVKSTIAHYTVAIRILRCIKGASSLGLFFSSNTSSHPKVFCDSDWGTCSDSRQSMTYLLLLLRILSYPKKQRSKEQYQRVHVKLKTGK